MANYTMKLKAREEVANGTMAFYFEKPEGFEFKAGQSGNFTLLDPPETDETGNTRTFSLASSPAEAELMVVTRMRDTAFKRVLGKASLGTPLKLSGPMGSFTLHNNIARPAVFLAGGVGIAPFRSMVLDVIERELPHKVFLFYSNRRPEDAAFLDELKSLEARNSNYRFISTMTQLEKSSLSWNGERGYIDRKLLSKYLPDLNGPIYYLAGPPGMVSALSETLSLTGVNADDVRSEEFAGY